MKTVFNNSMCAHVWAQQMQQHGRSDSMRFDGPVLYSYQTPIAAFTPEGVALITSERHSATTGGKHIPEARRAVRGESFTVPDVGYGGGWVRTARTAGEDYSRESPQAWRKVHEENLAWLVEQYREHVAKFMRTQSWYWADERDVYDSLVREAATIYNYAETFKLDPPALGTADDAKRIWTRYARLTAERNAPGAAEKRERARAQREAAKARREEKARAEKWARETEARANWVNGAASYWRGTDEHGGAYLRVRGNDVETSLGASVPVEDAARVWNIIRANRANHPTWSPDTAKRPKLGHFTLDSWNEKGIRAGCHFISWGEIERIAPQLEVSP